MVINLFDYVLGATAAHRLAIEKGIITTTPLETLTEYTEHYPEEKPTSWYESFYHKYYLNGEFELLKGIKSEIKELFYFYRKNREVINRVIYCRLKNHFNHSNR